VLAKKPVHTITFDNGTEFSQHEYMASSMRTDIYFAKPYGSWQRGRNENTNGLLRQYFPKKCRYMKCKMRPCKKRSLSSTVDRAKRWAGKRQMKYGLMGNSSYNFYTSCTSGVNPPNINLFRRSVVMVLIEPR
jgi:hypothetical protein